MFLILSGILFAIFFGNVLMGSLGGTSYLGDIGEFLVLLLTAICFTVAILKSEAKAKTQSAEPSSADPNSID
jgi:hypothetical protein